MFQHTNFGVTETFSVQHLASSDIFLPPHHYIMTLHFPKATMCVVQLMPSTWDLLVQSPLHSTLHVPRWSLHPHPHRGKGAQKHWVGELGTNVPHVLPWCCLGLFQSHHKAFAYAIWNSPCSVQLIAGISSWCPFDREGLNSMTWTVIPMVSRLSSNCKPPYHIPGL